MTSSPAFATDPATARYYDRRAAEYDDWYEGNGLFAERARPGWDEEVARLIAFVGELPAARTLDVACGTGYLTRHLRGFVVGLDQSAAMVEIAQSRLPAGLALVGDALSLPFGDRAFDRVFTGHFYGHLGPTEQERFLDEARRVADELVIVDAAARDGVGSQQWQERTLGDGSRHRVYKRYLSAAGLAAEIGGEPALDGRWFVAGRVAW